MAGIVFRTAAFAVLLIAIALGSAPAPGTAEPQRNQPGKFDFYVLALSWSPSFCKDTRGARPRVERAVPRPALRLRRARAVAAIRARLSARLPGAGAAAQPRTHDLDARPDAGAAARLSRVGPARHLLGPCGAGLFRSGAQGARGGENPRGLCGAQGHADGGAGRGRGGLRQGQSRPVARRPSRSPAAARG